MGKKTKKPREARRRAVTVQNIRSTLETEITAEHKQKQHSTQRAKPAYLEKLHNEKSSAVREEGCRDVAYFALDVSHVTSLLSNNVHTTLKIIMATDTNLDVRIAASTALRNLLSAGCDIEEAAKLLGESIVDDTLVKACLRNLSDTYALFMQNQNLNNSEGLNGDDEGDEDGDMELEDDDQTAKASNNNSNRNKKRGKSSNAATEQRSFIDSMEELLQFLALLAEGYDVAVDTFVSDGSFMTFLVEIMGYADTVRHSSPFSSAMLEDDDGGQQQEQQQQQQRQQKESHHRFLDHRHASMALAATAADMLHVISSMCEDEVARFCNHHLTPEQQSFLNNVTAPLSEEDAADFTGIQLQELSGETLEEVKFKALVLRRSLFACSTLMKTSPTGTNCQRIIPNLLRAAAPMSHATIKSLLPVLSGAVENADLYEGGERGLDAPLIKAKSAIQACSDILRNIQLSLDLFTEVVEFVCEVQDASLEDDVAFRKNPMSAMIAQSGIYDILVSHCQELLCPDKVDVMVASLLSGNMGNSLNSAFEDDVRSLRFLSSGVRVNVIDLLSKLLIVVPITDQKTSATPLGDLSNMWTAVLNTLVNTYDTNSAAPDDADENYVPQQWSDHVTFEIESLCEICWTLIRRDSNKCVVTPTTQAFDVFTRCAWDPNATDACRVFILGMFGCVGKRASTTREVNYACGNFCLRTLESQHFSPHLASEDEMLRVVSKVEVAVEAANSLIDIYSDERFDQSAYVPLKIHDSLQNFLATKLLSFLRAHSKKAQGAGGKKNRKNRKRAQGSGGSEAASAHLMIPDEAQEQMEEVATNLEAFLVYKGQNVGKW